MERFHSSTLKCLKTLRNGCCHTGGQGDVRCQAHRRSREGPAGPALSPAVTASAARRLGCERVSAPTRARRRGPLDPKTQPRSARRYLSPWRRSSRFPPLPTRTARRARSACLAKNQKRKGPKTRTYLILTDKIRSNSSFQKLPVASGFPSLLLRPNCSES